MDTNEWNKFIKEYRREKEEARKLLDSYQKNDNGKRNKKENKENEEVS